MADRRHVGSDLMRPAGLEPDSQEGRAGIGLQHLEVRARLPRMVGADGHPLALRPVAPDRRVDRARAGVGTPLDQRQVLALDLSPAGPTHGGPESSTGWTATRPV
jgi:hypothetical protein